MSKPVPDDNKAQECSSRHGRKEITWRRNRWRTIMSEEITATVSTESIETVDTQENVDTVQGRKARTTVLKSVRCYLPNALNGKLEALKTKLKKLAKMNADEKQKYQLDQREQELADREKGYRSVRIDRRS